MIRGPDRVRRFIAIFVIMRWRWTFFSRSNFSTPCYRWCRYWRHRHGAIEFLCCCYGIFGGHNTSVFLWWSFSPWCSSRVKGLLCLVRKFI